MPLRYGIREAGHEDIRWPWLPVGAWLALIALLVWIFTVIKDTEQKLVGAASNMGKNQVF